VVLVTAAVPSGIGTGGVARHCPTTRTAHIVLWAQKEVHDGPRAVYPTRFYWARGHHLEHRGIWPIGIYHANREIRMKHAETVTSESALDRARRGPRRQRGSWQRMRADYAARLSLSGGKVCCNPAALRHLVRSAGHSALADAVPPRICWGARAARAFLMPVTSVMPTDIDPRHWGLFVDQKRTAPPADACRPEYNVVVRKRQYDWLTRPRDDRTGATGKAILAWQKPRYCARCGFETVVNDAVATQLPACRASAISPAHAIRL